MAGTIHKITAGCGYEYLTRQVAAMDATDRGRVTLADYYSAKGEAPGRWTGAGLASLIHPTAEVPASAEREVHAGSVVSAEQMRALFGEGRHPNADEIEAQVAAAGGAAEDQLRASALGARWSETTAHPEFRVRLAEMFVAHNLGSGQRWSAPIADDVKAQMRTELGLEMFRDEYRRDPRDDRELSGWIARINRPLPQGVAGYDLTFSPVKSVSTLWALGHTSTRRVVVDGKEMDLSQAIEACHDKAVADAIAFVEDQATFSRLGTDGVQQVDTEGLIAAAFTHRDSRAGDPDLHTHVAVSNKVRVRVPGTDEYRWVALDGTPLFKAIVSSSEVYNSRIEAYVRQYIGAQFAERPSLDKSRRPIREIVGVPEELMSRWSQRREAIEIRQSELAAQFQAVHGREPTSGELFDLAQQATLETREAKHEPRSLNEQRDTWWTQAVDELGSSSNVNAALESVFTGEQAAIRTGPIQSEEATAIADHVVSVVSESRARWQRPHLRAEAERQLRQGRGCAAYTAYGSDTALPWAGWVSPEHWSESVEAIVRAAESASRTQAPEVTDSDQGEPQMLRRLDGASVYSTHDTAMWTSAEILAAERRIVAAARRTDGRVVDGIHVDLALLEEAANGRSLNAGQTALVRELAGSGRRVQLALAPAGTGKTTAMRAFGRAWTDSGGAVIGLAPTAAAAAVLREDLGAETDTLAKLVHIVRARADYEQAVLAAERGDLNARRALAAGDVRDPQRPPWFDRIGPSTVLVVDEAGMAATADLDALIGFAQSRGAAVRLVGDDQQLASISAGGVLRDVAHEVDALTLSEVVRFSDTAEGSASLALREGDVAGLGYLADHGRIHVASDRAAADQAFGAWLDDQSAGDDSVMLAATRDTTNDLNAAARAHRLDGLSAAEVGREIQLADGLSASVGDTICTRRNNRALRTSATDWVRNGDRWEITAIGQDGTVTARHRDRGRTIDLPAKYVAQHVTLGYASTIHAAQGLTADRCHVVGNDSLSRQLFYVAMTRGRHGNHVYLSTAEGDPHKVLTPKALTPDTAVELLSKVLDRDEAQRSATTGARQARDPATRLGPAAAAFIDAAGTLAEAAVGAERLAELADHTRQIDPRIVETSAWPVLRKHLATLELSPSGDATAALAAAYHSREIDSAADVAALLDWRLDPTSGHSAQQGPLPWLGSVPEHLPAEHVEYLHRRAQLVTSLADELREASGHWSTSTAPLWARPYVAAGADSALLGDLAVFRAAHGVSDSDSRPTGPAQPRTRTRKWQDALDERAAALVAVSADHERWSPVVAAVDPHILRDPYWPRLAEQLTDLSRSGLDVDALVRDAADTGPLPTELPAAALWWRLSGRVDPAVAETTSSGLRPDWINDVADALGPEAAEIVIADAAWPKLVAAVNDATATAAGWSPRGALRVANDALRAAAEDAGEALRLDRAATALARRVEQLVHTPADLPTIAPADEPLSLAELESVSPDQDPGTDRNIEPYAAAGLDEEYLAHLHADGPPPLDPYTELAAETWPDLEFDDHLPAPVAAPVTVDCGDFATLIADHYELTARRREVSDLVDAQWAAVSEGSGEHTLAAADMLAQLRAFADAQRPAHLALAQARDDAANAKAAVETFAADIARIDEDLYRLGRGPDYEIEPDLSEDADIADDLRQRHSVAVLRHQAAVAAAQSAATAVDEAERHWATVTAEHGGRAITGGDVAHMRMSVTGLDIDVLNDHRATLARINGRLQRIESALAHRHALTKPPTNAAVGYSMSEAQQRAAITAVAAELAADPVQLVPDAALQSTIRSVRKRIARTRDDLLVPPVTNRADTLRRDYTRVDEQVTKIVAARAAETVAADAAAVVTRARADLARHTATDPATLKRGARAEHAATDDKLRQILARAVAAEKRLRTAAEQARTAVGAHPRQWDAIAASADPSRRRRELDQARAADTRAADTRAADQTRLADAHAKLDRALAEVDRRDQLDPDRRIIEEAIRADQESVSTAVRNPMHHKRPSATADHHHDLDHNRGPDVGL